MGSGALLSLFAILGAAGLALVCDYLRHRNHELKTAIAAMQSGRTEPPAAAPMLAFQRKAQERVFAPASTPVWEQPQPLAEGEPESEPSPAVEIPSVEIRSRRPRQRRPATNSAEPEFVRRPAQTEEILAERSAFIERAKSVASEIDSRKKEVEPLPCGELLPLVVTEAKAAAARVSKSEVVPILEQMSSDSAMKDWLSRRAAARMALQSAPVPAPPAAAPAPTRIVEAPAQVALDHTARMALQPAPVPARPAAAPAPTQIVDKPAPVALDHKLWAAPPQDEPKLQLVARKEPAGASGIQDAAAFTRLLANWQPYNGLVICIGVKDITERVIEKTVSALLTGMAQPGETLFRSSQDEFVLLCPNDKVSDSRRRLSAISHQLWDYQLRNLSNFSVLFSWGSEEAWRTPLSHAVEAARDNTALTNKSRGPASAGRRKVI